MYCISKKYIELKQKQKELKSKLENIRIEIRDEISKKLKFICEECHTVNHPKEVDLLEVYYYDNTVYQESWNFNYFAFICKNCKKEYKLDEEEKNLFGYSDLFKSCKVVK